MPIWKENKKYFRITTTGIEKVTIQCTDTKTFDVMIKTGDADASRFAAKCKENMYTSHKM